MGFLPSFFHKYWHIVGNDVIKAVQRFFRHGWLPTASNFTLISLLAKGNNPTSVNHFWPISLYSFIYKIVLKTITKILQNILPNVISKYQAAFVKNHLITDNVLIAQELFHHICSRCKAKNYLIDLKLDMSKTFDRIEWSFVKAILTKLGFDSNFISWIFSCITSVSFACVIEGQVIGFFKPRRGLRRGDPLWP